MVACPEDTGVGIKCCWNLKKRLEDKTEERRRGEKKEKATEHGLYKQVALSLPRHFPSPTCLCRVGGGCGVNKEKHTSGRFFHTLSPDTVFLEKSDHKQIVHLMLLNAQFSAIKYIFLTGTDA